MIRQGTFRVSVWWWGFVLLGLSGSTAFAQELVRGPYVQNPTPFAITLQWRTSMPAPSGVAVGGDSNTLQVVNLSTNSVVDHLVTVTNLLPEQTYAYAVMTTTSQVPIAVAGQTFRTLPLPGTPGDRRLWILGDVGELDADGDMVRDAFLSFNKGQPLDGILLLGDNAYPSGTDAQYQLALFDPYADVIRSVPMWSTRGNHEMSTEVYEAIFSHPALGESGGFPSGTEAYYSFDVGTLHVVCLDSYASDRSPGGDMMTWLVNDLEATLQEWIVVFFHHPPYTKGSHDSDDPDDSAGIMRDMRDTFLPVLESYGVDLVMNGHSHSYERSALIHGHAGTSDLFDPETMVADGGTGNPDAGGQAYNSRVTTGTVYMVTGSASHTTGSLTRHPVMASWHHESGSVALDVRGDQLEATFVNLNGEVRDHVVIRHDNAQPALITQSHLPEEIGMDSLRVRALVTETGDTPTEIVLFSGPLPGTRMEDSWANRQPLGVHGTGVVETVISNLPSDSLTWYRFQARNAAGPVWATQVGVGYVGTGEPLWGPDLTGIPLSPFEVEVSAMLLSTGNSPTEVTVFCGETDGGMSTGAWERVKPLGVSSAQLVVAVISNLQPETLYHVRMLAENDLEAVWSAPLSLTTPDLLPELMFPAPPAPVTNILSRVEIPIGSSWRYLVTPTAAPVGWNQPGFDDTAWSQGNALLGFDTSGGDPGIATNLGYGGNPDDKYPTTYFRTLFVHSGGAEYLRLRLLRDDGAVIHLNGVEVLRDNLPAGPVSYDTLALSTVGGMDERTFFPFLIPTNGLVTGTNLLAVEVHQATPSSSDLAMDLEFRAEILKVTQSDPVVVAVGPTNATLRIEVSSVGGGETEVTLWAGTLDGGTLPGNWPMSVTTNVVSAGLVDLTLTNLTPATAYVARFRATNAYGLAWTGPVHFGTGDPCGLDCDGDSIPNYLDPDDDNDLLPDVWEDMHGLNRLNPADAWLDSDFDGASNLEEWIAGTLPRDAGSVFRLDPPLVQGGDLTLTWQTVTGRVYTLETTTNFLDAGAWQVLLLEQPTGTFHTVVPAIPLRGYRLGVSTNLPP